MYDPLVTLADLLNAHHELYIAADIAYENTFNTDDDRVAYLFKKYQEKKREEIK